MLKALLKKAEASGQDPYLALLSHRATPIDTKLPAPAKLLNQREYRTQLPSSGRIQRSQANEPDHQQLIHRQNVQKYQHDKKASRNLSDLRPGQPVGVYHPQVKTWIPAEVKAKTSEPRSYIVTMPSGSEIRRNRSHLRPTGKTMYAPEAPPSTPPQVQMPEAPPSTSPPPLPPQVQMPAMPPTETPTAADAGVTVTRSGRKVKPPQRLGR